MRPTGRIGSIALILPSTFGFAPTAFVAHRWHHEPVNAARDPMEELPTLERTNFWGTLLPILASCLVSSDAFALEESVPSPVPSATFSIEKCNPSSKAPCVSTANVRNLDLYLPPWTFTTSIDNAMSRLKGSIIVDPSCKIAEQIDSQYLKVEAKRSDIFGTVDYLEFVLNEQDKVVTFRSLSNTDGQDFGINKRRLEDIRKRTEVFGVMGEGLNTADSVSQGARGNGPLGQLKAFYGLQSGGGYEDVVLDLE